MMRTERGMLWLYGGDYDNAWMYNNSWGYIQTVTLPSVSVVGGTGLTTSSMFEIGRAHV